jgi:uncharacterized protein (DUF697 family)
MSDEYVTSFDAALIVDAEAISIVQRNMMWSAGVGLVPLPFVEFAAIAAVQLKMVNELCELYEVSFYQDLAKSSVAALIAGVGSVTLGKLFAVSSLRVFPVVGTALAVASTSVVSAGVTYAVGRVFITHFEAGGTLLDFQPSKARDFVRQEVEGYVRQKSKKGRSAAAIRREARAEATALRDAEVAV